MPPPHRMLSRGLAKEQTPARPPLHSNLGRYRIPGHRRIRGRNLETTPTIHHPLLHNNTPPRRSSTKNHDNRRARKLERRRINPQVRNQQMGPKENPGRDATSICFRIGVGMHAIPRNESDHASRNCRQLTRAHPGPLISTKETNRPSTVFAIPLDLTRARCTVPTCRRPTGQNASWGRRCRPPGPDRPFAASRLDRLHGHVSSRARTGPEEPGGPVPCRRPCVE